VRPLQGRIAIVTGSSSAIGAAISLALASQGCSLFCIDVSPTPTPTPSPPPRQGQGQSQGISTYANISTAARDQPGTHERIRHQGGEATYHKADTTRARDMDLAIRACVAKYRRVDILVTNASTNASTGTSTSAYSSPTSMTNTSTPPRPLRCHETTDEDFDRALAVHARAVFLACKYAVRQMLDGQPQRYARAKGWIVNVASIAGLVPLTGAAEEAAAAVMVGGGGGVGGGSASGFCAGQAAAVMLTRQIALDYAADAIHCNALCPGFVDAGSTHTAGMGMVKNVRRGPAQPQEGVAGVEEETEEENYRNDNEDMRSSESRLHNHHHPFGGRLGSVEDVARAAVFLCGDDAAWITGVTLPVDGGYLLR
jgi:NAD(P)-dependent dehydrogenase (short-subunit alcohol dehydrogenase family)